MRCEVFEDPAEFLAKTDQFLLRDEATNNLIVSFASMLVQSPGLTHNFFAQILDGETTVGAALWVPGRKLLATSCPAEGVIVLVDALVKAREAPQKLEGLYAPRSTAEKLAQAWAQVSGKKFEAGLAQVVMKLEFGKRPEKPEMPQGRFRRAWLEDLRLLRSWALAMAAETKIEEPPEETAELVRHMIEARRLFVWDSGGPVAMGGLSGNTPNGARINSVYVPPQFRRKGYARACTWSIGETLRQSRKKFACLFADHENPGSVALYQGLGYEIVGDICDYSLKVTRSVPASDTEAQRV